MARRTLVLRLALLALVTSAGCNAGPNGGLKRQEPPMAREAISKARIIAKHNENAEAIRSLKASPSIVFAATDDKGKVNQGSLKGRMAMERDRDFRLEISSTLHKQADIGSNAKGFWFWVRDNSERALYVCDHNRVDASPLAATMQPDWILESMGLRPIDEREAQTIDASKGDKPGQLVLTQRRNDSKGGLLTKVTIVDETSGEILEHRLYSGAKEKLLARATIAETRQITVRPTEGEAKEYTVNFPSRLKLEWLVEKFSLDIAMGESLTINPKFPEAQKLALFTEPSINGAVRTDLARLGGQAAAAPSSRIYESAPRGVRLGKPEVEPAGFDGADTTPRDVRPIDDLPSLPPTGYVGPQVPQAPESELVRSTAMPGWGRATFNR
jgi:hypothetical protein